MNLDTSLRNKILAFKHMNPLQKLQLKNMRKNLTNGLQMMSMMKALQRKYLTGNQMTL